MKTLSLIIKQEYFDQIIAGTKKQETRELKPNTENRYIETDAEGFAIEDENGDVVPKKYDALRLYVGYKKDRDSCLVEVTGAHTERYADDNGQVVEAVIIDGQLYDEAFLNHFRKIPYNDVDLTGRDKKVYEVANAIMRDDEEHPDDPDFFYVDDEKASELGIEFWTPGVVVYDLGRVLETTVKEK